MRMSTVAAVIALLALTTLPAVAQSRWTVGQHVKVFYPRPGGMGTAWRTGVVTGVFA